MSTALPLNESADRAAPRTSERAEGAARTSARGAGREVWVWLILSALMGGVWYAGDRHLIDASSDLGYWLGVAGGSMMLLLLLYPLRKHVRGFQRWGKVKAWLWVHMVLGVGGPVLVLLHCGLKASSVNAAAALYSMLIVAGSGVLGRFLYVRINRGLVTERSALTDLRLEYGYDGERRSALWFAPGVQENLQRFEVDALQRGVGAGRHWLRLVLVLPALSWSVRFQAQRQVRKGLAHLAAEQQWEAGHLRRRQRAASKVVVSHLAAVMRVAMFAAWERLFALWHVAHVPFVFLLVIAGVAHVIAVHAY